MGWVSNVIMEKPGAYLLSVLAKEGKVPYSRFYGTEEAEKALLEGIGYEEGDRYKEQAHVLLEFAAGQFERKGLITMTPLPEELIDGENDFMIELTEKGREFLAAGKPFKHWDMDF